MWVSHQKPYTEELRDDYHRTYQVICLGVGYASRQSYRRALGPTRLLRDAR